MSKSNLFDNSKFMLYHNLINYLNWIGKFKELNSNEIITVDDIILSFVNDNRNQSLVIMDSTNGKVESISINVLESALPMNDYSKFPSQEKITSIMDKMMSERSALIEDIVDAMSKRYSLSSNGGDTYIDSTSLMIVQVKDIETNPVIIATYKTKSGDLCSITIPNVVKYKVDKILEKVDVIISTAENL